MSIGSIGVAHPANIPAIPAVKSAKTAAGSSLVSRSTQRAAASLEGQIRMAREQLNDWVTCVSATTPKGQAEIQSLTAQISAAQEHINRLQPAANVATVNTDNSNGTSVDVWA